MKYVSKSGNQRPLFTLI